MRTRTLLCALFACITGIHAAAQETLAILPFTGAASEAAGEAIAELFSYDDRLNGVFDIIPRTSITWTIRRERDFQQTSGMTNPDTIARIGEELGAKYVVAGNITSLGSNNLLIISILRIDTLQLIAGDIQTFSNHQDIQKNKLPQMINTIIAATRKDTSKLEKLAVVPVQLKSGDQGIADTLAQALAIYIVQCGVYAVYPRTKSLEQVLEEHSNQRKGSTADQYKVDIGYGINPDFVLSVIARELDGIRMFNASIINIETQGQKIGRSIQYETLDNGITVMESLARELTGMAEKEGQEAAEEEARRKKKKAWNKFWFDDGKKMSSLGVNIGTSFATPLLIGNANITIPVFPYTFLEGGADIGLFHGNAGGEKINDVEYVSGYYYGRFNVFAPFDEGGGFYFGLGAGFMDAQYKFPQNEVSTQTPAFDVAAGFFFGEGRHFMRIGYALRTNFSGINHRLTAGYALRIY